LSVVSVKLAGVDQVKLAARLPIRDKNREPVPVKFDVTVIVEPNATVATFAVGVVTPEIENWLTKIAVAVLPAAVPRLLGEAPVAAAKRFIERLSPGLGMITHPVLVLVIQPFC
jgi:hypothetical protein